MNNVQQRVLLYQTVHKMCIFRAKDPKTLIAQSYKMRALNLINLDILGTIEPFRPVIDGIEFTDIPMKLFQQGIWNKEKHVIMGATTEEMYFVPVYIPEFFNITEEIFRVNFNMAL